MGNDNQDYIYYIWLTQINGIGPVIANRLIRIFKSPERIYNLSLEDFIHIEGIGNETAKKIIGTRDLSKAESIVRCCCVKDIKITTIDDDIFPERLKDDENIPIVLFYKGFLSKNSTGIAIVGARMCTEYGKKVSVEAAEFLARNNTIVISGMAKGIDSYAHTACIKAGGSTIAILGCGVDICYPKEHNQLMKKIIENGAVVSEYPPQTLPKPENFPKRNRIISALSNKVLIAEAGEKSGALITAKYAQNQKREVYVAPNDMYSKAFKGSNKLISEGAKIYLNHFQLLDKQVQDDQSVIVKKCTSYSNKELNIGKMEGNIIKILNNNPLTLDEMVIALKLEEVRLLDALLMMEISNVVKNVAGKYSICIR